MLRKIEYVENYRIRMLGGYVLYDDTNFVSNFSLNKKHLTAVTVGIVNRVYSKTVKSFD